MEETEAVDHKVLTLRYDFEDFIKKANIKENGMVDYKDKMSDYMKEFKQINRKLTFVPKTNLAAEMEPTIIKSISNTSLNKNEVNSDPTVVFKDN